MKHILGMAKSSLDLRGAKAPKLELDVLRLVYAVQHLRRSGAQAHGYLLVLDLTLATRARSWLKKYDAVDCVTCLCHSLSKEESTTLAVEKRANIDGIIAGSTNGAASNLSSAAVGQAIGESALEHLIKTHEPGVIVATAALPRPLSIRWDYYGILSENH